MKVARKIVQEKKALAKELIKKHPNFHLMLINDLIAERFGHKLNHGTLSSVRASMLDKDGNLRVKFADKTDPVAEKHKRRMQYVKPPQKGETLPGPVNLPPAVVAAAQLLLEAQRDNRVETVQIHSSGTMQAKVLAGIEGSVYLGGRRASDPKSEVG